jgi:hypothetical protein
MHIRHRVHSYIGHRLAEDDPPSFASDQYCDAVRRDPATLFGWRLREEETLSCRFAGASLHTN